MHVALVERARAGDEEAFASLARGAGDRLLAIAFRILRDLGLAEDAVQQTLVLAWRELPSLRDAERFDAWLHRLLVRACYRAARHRRERDVVEITFDSTLEPMTHDAQRGLAVRDQLDRGFRRLSPEQRAVIVLRHYLGLSLAECAEILAIPLGTMQSRLSRATQAMRAALEADDRPAVSGVGVA